MYNFSKKTRYKGPTEDSVTVSMSILHCIKCFSITNADKYNTYITKSYFENIKTGSKLEENDRNC